MKRNKFSFFNFQFSILLCALALSSCRPQSDDLLSYGQNDEQAYYDANMEIKNEKEMLKLINDDWPIYTMTNDSCPTLYKKGAKVTGSIVANGCQIEGTVINSVIGRNVVIKEGAVVKDSVILPDTLIDKNVTLENGVVDRLSIVTHIKDLKGTKEEPIYIKRGDRI